MVGDTMYTERKQITKYLSELLQQYIDPKNDTRVYYAREVTFDYGTQYAGRADYVEFRPRNNSVSGIESGAFYVYEVKSSVEDFHSKNGHNFVGDYNYYVMPIEVFNEIKSEIPYFVGVLTPETLYNKTTLHVIKQAKRHDRTRPCAEMLLMMFRSARRDTVNKCKI